MSAVHRLFPDPAPATNRFEEIWKLWPNKAKKPLARAKYTAILAGLKTRTLDKDSGQYVEIELAASEDQVMAGVKAYLKSQIDPQTYRLRDGGRFIPMLSTWLNGGRFQDHE